MKDRIIQIDEVEKTFSAHKIDTMVNDARENLCLDDFFSPENFVKSPVDPMNFLSAFPSLRIKNGYVLRAYVWRDMDGIGSIFAMKTDSPFPEPSDCPESNGGKGFGKPVPHDALDEIMQVVEGDDSLWSYLSASIFSREAYEFGAFGHSCDWRWHSIIGSDFWGPIEDTNKLDETIISDEPLAWKHTPDEDGEFTVTPIYDPSELAIEGPSKNTDDWDWEETVPQYWDPVVRKENNIVKVTFYTLSCYLSESITRHVDTYQYGNYEFQSVAKSIAWGEVGLRV